MLIGFLKVETSIIKIIEYLNEINYLLVSFEDNFFAVIKLMIKNGIIMLYTKRTFSEKALDIIEVKFELTVRVDK